MVMLYEVLFCMVIGFCKSRVLSFTISEDNAVAVIRLGGLNLSSHCGTFSDHHKSRKKSESHELSPSFNSYQHLVFFVSSLYPFPFPIFFFLRGAWGRGEVLEYFRTI